MNTIQQDVDQALSLSAEQNEIVTIRTHELVEFTALKDALELVCDDSVDNLNTVEYWSEQWRVHVRYESRRLS